MVRVKADPQEIITIDLPEWRIVDDATWFAVAERFTTRGPCLRAGRPTGKYPLTGIAKCGSCGGAIAAARVIAYGGPKERVLCYGCAKHHERGSAVCPVTVHQPMHEVEAALVDHLQKHVLSEGVLQLVLAEIRKLSFTPARSTDGTRAIWRIEGSASFSSLVEGVPSRLRCDPDGIRTRVTCVKGGCPRPLDDGVSY